MISIIVPAHNESAVIARTLTPWVTAARERNLEVIVVCNGCTDSTPEVVRRFGPDVHLVVSDIASKTHALNLGDQIATGYPRIYVDADVVLATEAVYALAKRLERGDVLAVAPAADINLEGCSWLIRKYFDIRARLPSSKEGIGGSGVYALSEAGRKRFIQFPGIIADDTFVRLQFKPQERDTLISARSLVFPARNISRLIAVRTRAYAGTLELTRRFPELLKNKTVSNGRSLIGLSKQPKLWFALAVYLYVNIMARCWALVAEVCGFSHWQRDETSRKSASDI